MTGPVVIKLGGSLALAPALRTWLGTIAAARAPVVVVAGGGPFADAVRAAQPVIGFGDRAAHRMAILAMAQFAEAMASLDDRLVLAASDGAIAAALERGQPVLWIRFRWRSTRRFRRAGTSPPTASRPGWRIASGRPI